MGGGDGDRDARLAERDPADAVLGGGRLQPVALNALAEDLRHPRLGHLAVGLVVQPLDVACGPLKADDGARARAADGRAEVLDRDRAVDDASVQVRAAAHRRDQGQLVARGKARLGVRVVAVHRHADWQPADHVPKARQLADSRDRLGHGCALGQLDLDLILPSPLAQDSE